MSAARKVAIVTGASSGLGREFALQIDRGEALDELWVIARRKERLSELRTLCETPVRPLPMDLVAEGSLDALSELLERERPSVRLLVCAAGFGKIGSYADVGREEAARMIELNCRAAVETTLRVLPYMERGARILEISSTSAFQPFQQLSVYAASKAFLLRYSRALRWELFPRGVHVTAVCPYWIKDTEFIPEAQRTKAPGAVRSFPFASRAETVARRALRDSAHNFAVSTPGPVCTLHRLIAKVIPSGLLQLGWEGLRRI